ncbi:hypothetical protein [Chryseobacterium oryctis]|uniref:C1q domain-containing protein n=1 Tax=Chryseobacterium oryctis TaxID=2952618 RepID=A0ABT3HS29_9FLAO|nr:hypothetical protein [Chryseobacterium oryctis]MCW3162587.1 hypothetical protein [Chryseobacterium oryctis]
MKTKIFKLIGAVISVSAFSQVGIGTPNPTAMLDVNGTMKVRQTPIVTNLTGQQILTVNQNSGGDFQVSQIDPQLLVNAANTDISVYAAKKTTGISLLSLALFPSGFRAVNFLTAEKTVGNSALFSDTDNTYIIPSPGVYEIGYHFRYGTGVQASVLANSPGIGIVRTRSNVATLIDSQTFAGANVPLVLSVTISESSLNSLYTFQAGDRISFGLISSALLDDSILGSSSGSFFVHKVSN